MISFRYHLVTIVAVFLALGLGLLAGTTVIDQQLVNGLRNNMERENAANERLTQELDSMQGRSDRQDALFESTVGQELAGALAGQSVVIVASDGIEADVVAPVRQSLESAGATVEGAFAVSSRVVDEGSRSALHERVPGGAEGLAPLLAQRLARGAPASGEDPLLGLLQDGFMVPIGRAQVGKEDLPAIGGAGQAVVVLGGHADDPVVQRVLLPLTGSLAKQSVPTGAGESAQADDQLIGLLRSDSSLRDVILTVDNADELVGSYALVLGLEQLLAEGLGGDYGFKPGSTALYPDGRVPVGG